MRNKYNQWYEDYIKKSKNWSQKNILGLFIFNILLILLLLLRSAGYFSPFLELDINAIVFISLILAVILLKVRNKVIFIISILFWIFAAFLRIVEVNVWAERTAIYAYESLFVGVIIMIGESIIEYIKKNDKYNQN